MAYNRFVLSEKWCILDFFIDRISHLCIWEIIKVPWWSLCSTPYLIIWISDLQLFIIIFWVYHWDSFWTSGKLLLWCRNDLVWKEGIIIYSAKGFLQVDEDTTGKFAIVKSISYHFCGACESMISWIIISKTKLVGKQYFIFPEKLVNWICITFSCNLLILDNREMGL